MPSFYIQQYITIVWHSTSEDNNYWFDPPPKEYWQVTFIVIFKYLGTFQFYSLTFYNNNNKPLPFSSLIWAPKDKQSTLSMFLAWFRHQSINKSIHSLFWLSLCTIHFVLQEIVYGEKQHNLPTFKGSSRTFAIWNQKGKQMKIVDNWEPVVSLNNVRFVKWPIG